METWVTGKALVAEWAGLDRDGLHILLGLLAFLVAAIALRRPLSNPLPWVAVLILCIADEMFSAWLDGTFGFGIVNTSGRDIGLAVAAPTLILLLGRLVPSRAGARGGTSIRILLPVPPANRRRDADVIDAEFTEIAAIEGDANDLTRLRPMPAVNVAARL